MSRITKGTIYNQIVLCGYNTFNAYGMLRSLGEAGIAPTLIINRCANPFLAKSKYAKGGVYYFDKPSDLPGLIREHIKPAKDKPIIICCDDPLQSALDCSYNDFKDDYLLSNCAEKQGEITRLMDKDVQMEIAKKCCLTVPKTWKLRKGSKVPTDMVYPCIVKPVLSIQGLKSQIRICHSHDELQYVLSLRDYLVQEFIEKDYEAIIWGTSIGKGDYYIPVLCRKLRQYPDSNSLSSYGTLDSLEQHGGLNMSSLKKFLNVLRYTGMFSIEMAVKDEKYYLLEINLRNDGKQYFSTAAGANLPLLYISSLIGKPFIKPTVKIPIFFMGETTDFKQIFRKRVSAIKWLRDLMRTNSFFIFNWKDPKPFISQSIGKLLSRFHK